MKKFFVAALAACLAFSLCACTELESLKDIELPPLPDVSATEAPAAETESPEESAEPVTADPAAGEALSNRLTVNISTTALEEYDPNTGEELILSFAYAEPHVDIQGRDAASSAINEYLGLLAETYYTGNDHGVGSATGYNLMLQQAQDNYSYVYGTGAEGVPLEFVSSQNVRIERADSSLLSMVYNSYEFTGGVHGNSVERAYVFDTETGERLSLSMLTDDYDGEEGLAAYLTGRMLEKAASDEYYSERIDPNTLPEEQYETAFAGLLRDGSWYFDQEGLVIFSDLYEFGPFAAGMVEFRIPYSELEGRIDEKWLPAERAGQGSFDLKPLSQVEDGSMEMIDRLALSQEGEELCLVAQGTVYDVKLSQVDYTDGFFETAQLWYGSYMRDCALQLVTLIPEGMPDLLLSYKTGDGAEHRLLLSENGQDGSPQLVEESSIEAVG